MPFGGDTYDRDRDRGRLLHELVRVRDYVMSSAKPTECSISVEQKRSRRVVHVMEAVHGQSCSISRWHTLNNIERNTEVPQASIQARLRDLRKAKFGGLNPDIPELGGWVMESQHLRVGQWKYRLIWVEPGKRKRLVRVGARRAQAT